MTTTFTIILTLYILFFAFIFYFCILADPTKSSLSRTLTINLPTYLSHKIRTLLGPRLSSHLRIISDYFLVIIYLSVVSGCWYVIFDTVFPMANGENVAMYHKPMAVLVCISSLASWMLVRSSDPGIITEDNLIKHDHYPYDGVLYVSDKVCPTTKIRKLARSKYDRYSKNQVARFDHYCGWIHRPVGEENYRLFLLFLFIHVAMCLYGCVMLSKMLWYEVTSQGLFHATFFNARTGVEVEAGVMVVVQYVLHRYMYMCFVCLLTGVLGVFLGGFLVWHLVMVGRGMTTNEYFKWKAVWKWHGEAMKKYEAYLEEEQQRQQQQQQQERVGGITTSVGGENGNIVAVGDHHHDDDDQAVGCTGPTTTDSQSQQAGNGEKEKEGVVMNPGPLPKNIYNLGVVENFREVLFPRSLRPEALDRYEESLKEKNNKRHGGAGKGTNRRKPKAV